MKEPKVVVLILSYNGKHLLDDSISSYLSNDYPNKQIVVIDNGSADGTQAFVRKNYPEAEVIRLEKNRGYSGGFNFGLDHAFNLLKADYVLITNDDVIADQQMISHLLTTAEPAPEIGFVTGKVFFADDPEVLQTVGKTEHPIRWSGPDMGFGEKDEGQYEEDRELPFADDVFMLVSKELYGAVGGYDETFFLQSEQFDWQVRAKKAGFRIFFSHKAFLHHKESMTIGKVSAQKEYYNARNHMLVILKHREAAFFRKYFWNTFIYRIAYFSLKSAARLELKKAVYIWRGFFSALGWGIRNRKFTIRHFI